MSAVNHYENFPVASVLCPAHLREAVVAIYHFARTADDIADEGQASAEERLHLLATLRTDLQNGFQQNGPISSHWPAMLEALWRQMHAFDIPIEHLLALLSAFEQDVVHTRDKRIYQNRTELLDYCSRSANPIGRLLLHLYGIKDALALQQSDAICSALQLINFWQDLSVDIPRGRFYLPVDAKLADELAFARSLMRKGAGLVHQVPGRAGWELRLVVQGGLRVLDKISRIDTFKHRPQLKPADVALMLWRSLWMASKPPHNE
jgi:squalene synthase HpnC